jgi:hypothetical protein
MIALIGVHLDVDDRHGFLPLYGGTLAAVAREA